MGYPNATTGGVEMSEWISVKDRLPCDTSLVLCFDGENIYIAGLYDDRSGFDIPCGYYVGKPTHWMPPPTPPEPPKE